MILETYCCGPCDTNSYLVGDPSSKKAFVVDTSEGSALPIKKSLEKQGLVLDRIFLTHSHQDHIADAKKLCSLTKAPLFVHILDAPNLENPGADGLPIFMKTDPVTPNGFIKEGDVISIGSFEIHVMETPGHSPGGICLYLPKDGIIFSGDTLFRGTMGRIDFPTSNATGMWSSLKRLASLPGNVKVFPGHGDPTSVREESWMAKAEEKFS